MKLRNKKTGETINVDFIYPETAEFFYPNFRLADFNELFEDYEEPKEFYVIENRGMVGSRFRTGDRYEEMYKEIGNYFASKEEAVEAVEKLKAWKRLKDKGFRFTDWNCPCRELEFTVDEDKFFKASGGVSKETRADLDLLFGGEE